MSENTNIEWCDHTFNPWEGCQKVSPGCDNCYAETRNKRFGGGVSPNWGPGAPRRRTSVKNWNLPVAWNAAHEGFKAQHGRRQRVFCASLADWLDNAVPIEWLIDLLDLIRRTPDLDWLLLTKRIGNFEARLREAKDAIDFDKQRDLWLFIKAWLNGEEIPQNVWAGASIVNQEEADRDIPKLLTVRAPIHFLSMEPLLGPVHIRDHWLIHHHSGDAAIDWVIVGGESGPGARPMHPDWARALRDQCAVAGTPLLFKQWGEWLPINQQEEAFTRRLYRSNRIAKLHEDQAALDDCYGRTCTVASGVVQRDGSLHGITEPMAFLQGTSPMQTFNVGKKAAGRLLDHAQHDGYPK